MPDDPIKQSRRAIDLYTADQFGRIDEKLKNMERSVAALSEEVFGAHGQPGLGETVRSIVKTWGLIIGAMTTAVSWFPWIYDHFIAKVANAPVFGEEVRERWVKQSSKRVRLFNPETKTWEYYYAITDRKVPTAEAEKENP